MSNRNPELDSLFQAALEKTPGPSREAFLAEHCAHDPELRRQIDSLLLAHAEMGSQFLHPTLEPTLPLSVTEESGNQIGPYKLLQQAGEGGMGVVYLAEQRHPVKRRVALKIIKAGMDSKQVIARFEAERQALAMMDHANIAKVFDAGTTDSGLPFFVMELVEGKPITNFCDEHKLGIHERLEIFRRVCSAVQHAHQKGIIHRDLKPSNVLVTLQDDQPVPKVIDFGLAKATGPQLTEKTIFTAQGQLLGTLEYMSPEQANLNDMDVDTRSDIYSLGVILYELLTGSTPLNRESVKRVAFMEVLKRIKEEEPERPSSRISHSSDSAESISSVRQIEPRKLSSLMKGELDWVVMKAIEKDRNRRYETANGLAKDVERFLLDDPVSARPPSVSYRLAKTLRKHRVVLTMVSVALIFVVAAVGIVLSLMQQQQRSIEAAGLVTRLIDADTSRVDIVINDLEPYRELATDKLKSVFLESEMDSQAKLHTALALLGHDPQSLDYLGKRLLTVKPNQFRTVCKLLAPCSELLVDEYWQIANGDSMDETRFQAACALASFDPQSDHWQDEELNRFLADSLVSVLPTHFGPWLDELVEVKKGLIEPLTLIFKNEDSSEKQVSFATSALATYLSDDPDKLGDLLTISEPDSFSVLYPVFTATASSKHVDQLATIAAELPPDELGSLERIRFGQRRANAAVVLLRMGEVEKVFPVFEFTDDPEALTQFVFRCFERDVKVESLLECLDIFSAAPLGRYPKDTLYALLLTLGEFKLNDVPESQRQELLTQISDWFANDPSAGVHSAAGWLLRHWGQTEIAQEIEQQEVPYSPDKEWFTLAITVTPVSPSTQEKSESDDSNQGSDEADNASKTDNSNGANDGDPSEKVKQDPTSKPMNENENAPKILPERTFYYTFVVCSPGQYWIGSVDDEPARQKDELRHQIELTHPFAVLDREITMEELIAFSPDRYTGYMQQNGASPMDAGYGSSWYDSVAFSRWLGKQMDLQEGDQPYRSPDLLDKKTYPREPDPKSNWAPRNWPVELGNPGLRIPTESEWAVVTRASSRTAYCFGSDLRLLNRYGWFVENSGRKVRPTRELRPSVRGIFDTHGNLYEWTHDWYRDKPGNEAAPKGPESGNFRTYRGGCWENDAESCRTANRSSDIPISRWGVGGFRLAMSLPVVVPKGKTEQKAQAESN